MGNIYQGCASPGRLRMGRVGYEYPSCGLVCLVACLGCRWGLVVWGTEGRAERRKKGRQKVMIARFDDVNIL